MIDAILTNTMLPHISREFLTRTLNGEEVSKLNVTAAESQFVYQFE
jgi:type VI secretion system protein VasG